MITVNEVLGKLTCVSKSGNGWKAICPAHDDHAPSLSIWTTKDGGIGLNCHAGCSHEAVCHALGIEPRDCFPREAQRDGGDQRKGAAKSKGKIVAAYDYFTKDCKPIVRVVRYNPKGFSRMSPDGKGGWIWGGTSNVVALYRWPELAEACARGGQTVYLVEGEKDTDNMRQAGAVATTCLGGASKWQPQLAKEFRGAAQVFIIADRDGEGNGFKGQKLALGEKRSIEAEGVKVRAVCLPAEIDGKKIKDASDALAAGWTLADISRHCETADEVGAEFPQIVGDTNGGADMARTMAEAIEKALDDAETTLDRGQKLTRDSRRKITIKAALEWMGRNGQFYFNEECSDASGGLYFVKKSKRLLRIDTDGKAPFYTWLHDQSGLQSLGGDFKQLLDECKRMGAEHSARIRPSRFWDYRDGRIYISNGEGEMARIGAEGCQIVDNGTDGVLFMSGRTCERWRLLPKSEGLPIHAMRLFGDISTPGNALAPLLLELYILSLPRNLKNKPPLSLCGDVGSGKTRTARGIFELLGMTERICTADKSDKGAEEFWASVAYGGISVIDNVDSKCKWLPDSVAGATTGGQKEKRKLYTDEDLAFLKSRSNVVITSANPLYATDAGLADRLINIVFARPGDGDRKSDDAALSREIEESRDRVMTWIAHAISSALRVTEQPPADLNTRHPDFGAWCWRCGVALGWRDETERVLFRAEKDKADISIRSDPVIGSVLYRIFGELGCDWEGTAAQLRELMVKGGDDLGGCGKNPETFQIISAGMVKPEEYDERTKAFLSPHRIGKYLSTAKTALQKVFDLRQRTLTGQTFWRFSPPKQHGDDDTRGAFLQELRRLFPKRGDNAEAPHEVADIPGGVDSPDETCDEEGQEKYWGDDEDSGYPDPV